MICDRKSMLIRVYSEFKSISVEFRVTPRITFHNIRYMFVLRIWFLLYALTLYEMGRTFLQKHNFKELTDKKNEWPQDTRLRQTNFNTCTQVKDFKEPFQPWNNHRKRDSIFLLTKMFIISSTILGVHLDSFEFWPFNLRSARLMFCF